MKRLSFVGRSAYAHGLCQLFFEVNKHKMGTMRLHNIFMSLTCVKRYNVSKYMLYFNVLIFYEFSLWYYCKCFSSLLLIFIIIVYINKYSHILNDRSNLLNIKKRNNKCIKYFVILTKRKNELLSQELINPKKYLTIQNHSELHVTRLI